MTTQPDDASPRRPPGADDPDGRDHDSATPETEAEATQSKPEERKIGPPVDPYAEPLHGAGPYQDPVAGEEDVVAGDVYHATASPGTEMQRLRQYRKEQDAESPPKPPPEAVGNYPYESHLPTHPTDPIRQFSSLGGAKPRRRRSDWPVLTFAMVAAAVVTALCCLGGFGLFSTWHPFK
jgi:hypothetical protein